MTTRNGQTAIEVARQNGAAIVQADDDARLMEIMARAVEMDKVEALERIVALKERMDDRRARAAFFEALAAVQEALPEIPKKRQATITTRSGGSYAYTYAGLEDITRTIRPVLRDHGLSYSWDVTQQGEGGALIVTCILRHVEGHEERAAFPVPVDTKAAMSDAQKNGAALTYGRRQSLVAVLGLTTADDDIDGAAVGRSSGAITARQAADLDALIDEVGADRGKFLRWAGVERLADLPAERYEPAVRMLERKRGAR
ncbi:MAG TPA: ERF family protein [Longimicrobiales bacterium]